MGGRTGPEQERNTGQAPGHGGVLQEQGEEGNASSMLTTPDMISIATSYVLRALQWREGQGDLG